MPYTAEISRRNPMCFIFLIDQSGSMGERWGADSNKDKSEGVADATNKILDSLVNTCSKGETVLDYYHVGVIGYGMNVGSLLQRHAEESCLVNISELAESPQSYEKRTKLYPDGAGDVVEREIEFPVWFEPQAYGPTLMADAMSLAHDVASQFIHNYPECHPPIVINITDGAAHNMKQTIDEARRLRSLSSVDGELLLFNVHISHLQNRQIEFPDPDQELPDGFAQQLFNMSSVIPPSMQKLASAQEFHVSPASRGFVFNADMVSLVRFLNIGTRHTQMRLIEHAT